MPGTSGRRGRHKHLSRAHRAAIRRGLRRYHRRIARAKAKRNARRRLQAKARRELQQIQARLPKRVRDREEWEITIRYREGSKKAVGITLRVIAPAGTPQEVALLVAKRAGQTGKVEKGFEIRMINWQAGRHGKEYDYGNDVETGLSVPGFTALFASSDVRAERVKETSMSLEEVLSQLTGFRKRVLKPRRGK